MLRIMYCLLVGSCVFDSSSTARGRDSGVIDSGGAPIDASMDAVIASYDASMSDASCIAQTPPTVAGDEIQLDSTFAGQYTIYTLGNPIGQPIGGLSEAADPNKLLFIGNFDENSADIYEISLERGPCGHILGFEGAAAEVAESPRGSTGLVRMASGTLLYSNWKDRSLDQTLPGSMTGVIQHTLTTQVPSGLGLVPESLQAAGQLRMTTWPDGHWYHVSLATAGNYYNIGDMTKTMDLQSGGAGGFAYLPKGSPASDETSIVLAEWDSGFDIAENRLALFRVNQQGDPIVSSRKEFLSKTPFPWGVHLDSVSGDLLVSTWTADESIVYVIPAFSN